MRIRIKAYALPHKHQIGSLHQRTPKRTLHTYVIYTLSEFGCK